MARPRKLSEAEIVRLKERHASSEKPSLSILADEFSVSKGTVSRLLKTTLAAPTRANLGEYGVTGLNRFGGSVDEDYQPEWRTLSKLVPTVQRMLDHPIISAVAFAVEMTLRSSEMTVQPASEATVDVEAADFLRGCLDDMSHSFDDHLTQAVTMAWYGFAPFEIVYKRRLGPDKDPASSFNDGLIGWRKFGYRAPATLTPGNEWKFDDAGGIEGINQTPPTGGNSVFIPMERLLLYRTNSVKNNPQGRSALRGAYTAWYFAKNLAEIEAISAERMGSGFPVMYLGDGTTLHGENSDFEQAKNLVRNVRTDEQMGIVIPRPKMTSDGRGMLFELMSPPSRGIVDFDKVITRYNQQMAQTLLAQFIFLGMTERGTQALAVRSTDFFSEAISGWLETIAETLNRFAVPRLFQINAASFAGITGFPTIEFGPVGQLDVQKLMDAISKASAAGALKLEVDDERTVRQALELPELTDDMLKERERRKAEMAKQMASAPQPPPGGGNEKKPDLGKDGDEGQQFAAVRGAGAGQLRTWERATNDYQRWLGENYGGWARQLARDLSEAESEDDYDDIINEALAALAVAMRQAGRENITRTLGLVGGGAATPRLLASVSQLIEDNETAIDSSLVPAIRSRLQSGLRDPDIQATGFVAILGLLAGFGARVESYAGGMWSAIQHAAGEAATSATAEGTGEVRWNRDAQAAHCEDCLQFGDRTYESFDAMLAETGNRVPGQVKCDGNCRCWLEVNLDGEFARP